jgi:F-type H+-transporting ATPase subunit epsilon
MTMQVELVSPERILFSGEAVMVVARTLGGGDIAFLTGHAPFMGALDIFPVHIRLADDTDMVAAVHGGFISVQNDHIKILSDLAELQDQIDVDRARRAAEEAEAAARQGDNDVAEAELRRAHARLAAAGASTSSSH